MMSSLRSKFCRVILILFRLNVIPLLGAMKMSYALQTYVQPRYLSSFRTHDNLLRRNPRSTGLFYYAPGTNLYNQPLRVKSKVPRRWLKTEGGTELALSRDWRDIWGVEYRYPLVNFPSTSRISSDFAASTSFVNFSEMDYFPSTIHQVTDAVAATIEAILRSNETFPDHNLMQNAVNGYSFSGRRSVRHPFHDRGRIGIELDWSSHSERDNSVIDRYDFSAVRLASLVLAGKLSHFQPYGSPDSERVDASNGYKKKRPIAIYFNTVQQALEASRQLRQLKQLDLSRQIPNVSEEIYCGDSVSMFPSFYDNIHIRCLCQGDTIPKDLIQFGEDAEKLTSEITRSRQLRRLVTGGVNPEAGVILVVQPTDFNSEHRPPGPSIGVVESLQRLVAAAAIEQLPVALISPRFLKAQSSPSSGWDQSGYHQQSSLYAGLEPPKGPTPWILRDFTPPAFCYVANALPLYGREALTNSKGIRARVSHLSLFQSVVHKGHAWNVFAASQETASDSCEYICIATTKNLAGRPTRQVMRQVWNDYVSWQLDMNEASFT